MINSLEPINETTPTPPIRRCSQSYERMGTAKIQHARHPKSKLLWGGKHTMNILGGKGVCVKAGVYLIDRRAHFHCESMDTSPAYEECTLVTVLVHVTPRPSLLLLML